ncbi:MAG: ATP synthase F1 subunit gamma [Chloroflexota bacterium]
MATAREIRRRIRSVKNIAKITKAMQLVAASHVRRAQQRVAEARPYADALAEILAGLATQTGKARNPLLITRPPERVLIVEVTPDRGLCGSLVSNLHRKVARELADRQGNKSMVAVGRKARDFARRTNTKLLAEFTGIPDRPSLSDISAVARLVVDAYSDQQIDLVLLGYTRFINTLNQQPMLEQLLPVVPPPESTSTSSFLYEPDEEAVLADLLPRYIETRLYQALLESKASEWSARMVAMRNATDNANEMAQDFTLALNKARQAGITSEIAEIAAGAAALS